MIPDAMRAPWVKCVEPIRLMCPDVSCLKSASGTAQRSAEHGAPELPWMQNSDLLLHH